MNTFLLAAGKGLRLRPYTQNIPKCLIKIKKKPLLDFWLNKLEKINISNIYLIKILKAHRLIEKFHRLKPILYFLKKRNI